MFVKKSITVEIMHTIQKNGRFLVKRSNCWHVVPDGVARQKIAHSIQYRQRCALKEPNDTGFTGLASRRNIHEAKFKAQEACVQNDHNNMILVQSSNRTTTDHHNVSRKPNKSLRSTTQDREYQEYRSHASNRNMFDQADTLGNKSTQYSQGINDTNNQVLLQKIYNHLRAGSQLDDDTRNLADEDSYDHRKVSHETSLHFPESLSLIDRKSSQDHGTYVEDATCSINPPLLRHIDRMPVPGTLECAGYRQSTKLAVCLDCMPSGIDTLPLSFLVRDTSGFSQDLSNITIAGGYYSTDDCDSCIV